MLEGLDVGLEEVGPPCRNLRSGIERETGWIQKRTHDIATFGVERRESGVERRTDTLPTLIKRDTRTPVANRWTRGENHCDRRGPQLADAQGAHQPILVETQPPGKFGSLDAIDFYGAGIDTIWSGTQVYWLVAGLGNGLRIGAGSASHGPPDQAIDITDPGNVTLAPGTVGGSAGNYSISLVPEGGGARTLLALTSARFGVPVSIVANHPSSWHSPQSGRKATPCR